MVSVNISHTQTKMFVVQVQYSDILSTSSQKKMINTPCNFDNDPDKHWLQILRIFANTGPYAPWRKLI